MGDKEGMKDAIREEEEEGVGHRRPHQIVPRYPLFLVGLSLLNSHYFPKFSSVACASSHQLASSLLQLFYLEQTADELKDSCQKLFKGCKKFM